MDQCCGALLTCKAEMKTLSVACGMFILSQDSTGINSTAINNRQPRGAFKFDIYLILNILCTVSYP